MIDLEWTSASFEASHRGPFAKAIHGHLWHVRICWPAEPEIDAGLMHQRLKVCLTRWDHMMLDDLVTPTNYGIAKAVGGLIKGVVRVEVWRDGNVPSGASWNRP